MARRRDPLREQVEAEALVRQAPERSALAALMRQLVADKAQDVAVAESTSRGLTNAARAAAPRVREIGDVTKMELGGARNRLTEQMATLSPVADAIKAATQRDFGGADARLGMELRRSKKELESRKLDAASGRLSAVGAAQSTYARDKAKITARILELAQEQGVFAQSQYGKLREGQRGRQHESREARRKRQADAREAERNRRNARTVAGVDAGGRVIPGGAKDKPGRGGSGSKVKWATPVQQGAARDAITTAIREANLLKAGGASRSEVAQLLAAGAKEQTRPVYDSSGKKVLNPDGTQKVRRIPGLPKVAQQEFLSAGLDIAFDGHLSRHTQRLLQQNRKIRVKPLGLTTYGQWKRQQPARGSSPYDTPAARTGGN